MNSSPIISPRLWIKRTVTCLLVSVTLSACSWFGFTTDEEDEQNAIERSLRKVADSSQQTNDYISAARYFENLHKKNPDDVEVTLGLARNLRYAGTPKRAALVLRNALKRDANNAHFLSELGRALIAGGEPEAALTPLSSSLEIAEDNWRTLSAIGVANDQLGRHELAREAYQTAQEISPENTAILNNLALSWALSQQLSHAITILERAEKLPGATAQVRQNLALMHGIQGNEKRAYELARLDLPEEVARENIRYYVSLREGQQTGGLIPASSEAASYSIQVGAYASPSIAENAWRALQRAHPDLLSTFQAEVYDKKDGGTVPFVVWAGPLKNINSATRLCTALRNRSAQCLVVMQ